MENTTVMPRTQSSVAESLRYFAYTGWITAIVIGLWIFNWWRLGDRGWMLTTQLLAIGILTAILVLSAALRVRVLTLPPRLRRIVDLFGAFALVATACVLMVLDHRSVTIAIALIQVSAYVALMPEVRFDTKIAIAAVSAISWALATGMTYTHLGDWLLNASPTTGLAVLAFVASFGLVIAEFADVRPATTAKRGLPLFLLALVVFTAFAFRTDHLNDEWFLIHRSYFADVAQLVRQGHWLLWDTPSGYGLLSIASIAALPAANGYQAVYELEAIFLIAQASIMFVILRWGRTSWTNAIFAIVLPLAVLYDDNIGRYPWGPREYQQGGLRFCFILMLLFIAFMRYVWRDFPKRSALLLWAGHVLWVVSLFWSFEDGILATGTWIAYVVIDAATIEGPWSLGKMLRRLLARLGPMALVAGAVFFGIELFYKIGLGALPDWRGYVEFAGLFTAGKVRQVFWVQTLGAGWAAVLALSAMGIVGITIVRLQKLALIPLIGIAWAAAWISTSYFAVEPIDSYVYLLMQVYVTTFGIALFATREARLEDVTTLLARLSLVPILVLLLSHLPGEWTRFTSMALPLTEHWSLDVANDIPPMDGEPAALLARAGVAPGAPLILRQGSYWTEIDQGLFMPFARVGNTEVEYRAWLPVSPIGPQEVFKALTPARQNVYVNRFLDRTKSGGWYLDYREPADCTVWSKRLKTVRTLNSVNFSLSLCAYVGANDKH